MRTEMMLVCGLLAAVAHGGGLRDYWCTWETQRALWKGTTCERDNMNEQVLFGEDGWTKLFPQARGGLLLVIDDGWDVPYGAANKGEGYRDFGSLDPDPVRFPSLKGTRAEKLAELVRRVKAAGWGGLGIWVASQAHGEHSGHKLSREELKADIIAKLVDCAKAGISYWKVDWGVHSADVWYREMMSELATKYAPDLIVDHSLGFDNAVNGRAHPYAPPWEPGKPLPKIDGDTGRMIGVADFLPVAEKYTAMMKYSDSFRTYDTLGPMTAATALERAVFELKCADSTRSRCTINVEDEPLIGAALALGIGVMRSAVWPDPKVAEPDPKQRRIAEIARCVNWRRHAPVFGSDRACPVRYSEVTGEENWKFEKDSTWWSAAFGLTLVQRAPSVVARGMELPEVKSATGERPLICASRHPDTGAIAVASLPMLTVEKGRHTPSAEVVLPTVFGEGVSLAVFGELGSVSLKIAPAFARKLAAGEMRLKARDLAGGEGVSFKGYRLEGGRIVLDGAELARIGRAANPAGDPSSPGVIVVAK